MLISAKKNIVLNLEIATQNSSVTQKRLAEILQKISIIMSLDLMIINAVDKFDGNIPTEKKVKIQKSNQKTISLLLMMMMMKVCFVVVDHHNHYRFKTKEKHIKNIMIMMITMIDF